MIFSIVTGSSRGIGRAIAEELASRKHALILVALPGEGLESVADEIKKKFQVEVLFFESDLSKADASELFYHWFTEKKLRADILVNNAGFGILGPFLNNSLEVNQKLVMVNVFSIVSLTRLFVPVLLREKKAWIMNLSSTAGLLPVPFKTAYSASKSFVYTFSQALRLELKGNNISVMTLIPGATSTSPEVQARINAAGFFSRKSALTAQEVAKSGVTALFNGRSRKIPGLLNRILVFIVTTIPYFIAAIVLKDTFSKPAG